MILATTLILATIVSAAQAAPLPWPKPTGLGGSCLHGYRRQRLVLRAKLGRSGRRAEAAERDVSVRMAVSGSFCLRAGSQK